MFNGYRGIGIAALGAVTVLAALGTGAYFGALYSPNNQQHQAVGGDTSASESGQYRGQPLSDIAGLPEPIERAIKNPPAENRQDREQRDLAAQESMAAWAFYMALFAGLTALVTFVGTILIWKQVSLTREAVKDTGDATNAMVLQTKISERSLDALYRPRVHIRAFGPLVSNEDIRQMQDGEEARIIGLHARVLFKNAGVEPLVILEDGVWADTEMRAPETNPRNDFVEPGREVLLGWSANIPEIAGTVQRTSVGQYRLTEENRPHLFVGPPVLGRVVYRNILDEVYEHVFAFQPIGVWVESEWRIWGGEEYNHRRKIA